MPWVIVESIFGWIINIVSTISFILVLFILFRFFLWDRVKKFFKRDSVYSDSEILEEDPFWGKEKDNKIKKRALHNS